MTQDTSMNINEILDHLPHRYPFVLVDKVISYEIGKNIEALKIFWESLGGIVSQMKADEHDQIFS